MKVAIWEFKRVASPCPPSLHVDWAPPTIAYVRRTQWTLASLLVSAVAYTGWCWQETVYLQLDSRPQEEAVARLDRHNAELQQNLIRDGLNYTDAEVATIHKQIAFTNQLADKRSFSWVRLLHDLGEGLPSQTSIESVKWHFQESSIELTGVVRSLQDLRAMASQLETHAQFSNVQVGQYQIVTPARHHEAHESLAHESDMRTHVSFTLRVTYRIS